MTTTVARSAAPSAPGQSPHRAIVAVGAFTCLVVALQQTLIVPAIPRFGVELNAGPSAIGWLVTATLLTGAIATPVIGRLADLFGKRRMMLIAMAFVLVGSVLAPLGGITLLITGRALQGVGTALVPVAMAQMRDSLPAPRVPGALAVLSATLGVGGGIGIPLGGVIASSLGWQWMFWFSAALSVASLALIALVMPTNHEGDKGSFDLPGAVLFAVALSALLLFVSQGNAWGWTSPSTLGALVIGLVVSVVWGVFELRRPSPLVDLLTSASRPLLMTNIASVLMGVLMFTNLLLTTLTLQNPDADGGFGWSADSAGLAMLPNAAAMFAVAGLSGALARRHGPRAVLVIGAAVIGVGYLLRLLATPNAPAAIMWTTVIGIGAGIGYAALPMLVVKHAPAREMGSANGVNALMRAVGSAIASSMVTAVSASFAVTMAGRTHPSHTGLSVVAGIGVALALVAGCFALAAREGKD